MRTLLFTLLFCFSIITAFAQNTDSSLVSTNRQFHFSFWDSLPAPKGWVNDYESLFTKEEVNQLDSIISDFKKQTTIEIAIVTFDTSATPKERFEELTFHIAHTWGIGEKDKDNGILIGISKGYRKMRIDNGLGISSFFSDEETKNIIDKNFIPSFKKGNYFEGTLNGLNAIIHKLKTH